MPQLKSDVWCLLYRTERTIFICSITRALTHTWLKMILYNPEKGLEILTQYSPKKTTQIKY